MKKFILLMWITVIACTAHVTKGTESKTDTVFVHDTIPCFIEQHSQIPDFSEDPLKKRYDFVIDSLRTVNSQLTARLIRIRKYVNICERNPSQKKFLLGWIIRSIK